MKNRLFDATLVAVDRLVVDGDEIDVAHVVLELGGAEIPAAGPHDDGIPFRCAASSGCGSRATRCPTAPTIW